MLVVDRASKTFQDLRFRDLPAFLRLGDCVVLNDSRVLPSRLYGKTASGAVVQVFLLQPEQPLLWSALVRPGRRLLPRQVIRFDAGIAAEVVEVRERGERLMRFTGVCDDEELRARLDQIGHVPLPPYIHRPDDLADRERYQTVFAERPG